MIYVPRLFEQEGQPCLAWYVEMHSSGDLVDSEAVIVDARQGGVEYHYPLEGHLHYKITDYVETDIFDNDPTNDDDPDTGYLEPDLSDHPDTWLLVEYLQDVADFYEQFEFIPEGETESRAIYDLGW